MSASLPIEILRKYRGRSRVFFETGTSEGDSLQTALEAGFDYYCSVEMDDKTQKRAMARFSDEDNLVVNHGDSVEALKELLPDISQAICFFLDAHPDSETACTPLLDELRAIRDYCTNVGAIFIDDMRLVGANKWKFTIQDILDLVEEINPEFKFLQVDNAHDKNDLFVAYLKESIL
jgi:hypothetical protein